MSKNEEIKLTVKNLFFEGGVTMSKLSFIEILQYALAKVLVEANYKTKVIEKIKIV